MASMDKIMLLYEAVNQHTHLMNNIIFCRLYRHEHLFSATLSEILQSMYKINYGVVTNRTLKLLWLIVKLPKNSCCGFNGITFKSMANF